MPHASPPSDDFSPKPSAQAIALLTAAHRDFLAFLQRKVRDRALAEDILQEAFARGIEHIDTLREQESAMAWFYRTLRNAVIDQRRRNHSTNRALDTFAKELSTAPEQVQPEFTQLVCRCISQLASTLRPDYAQALQRVDLDGLSVRDFAAENGLTPSNAGVRLYRARQALRAQLAVCCGTCAEHECLDCHCQSPRREKV